MAKNSILHPLSRLLLFNLHLVLVAENSLYSQVSIKRASSFKRDLEYMKSIANYAPKIVDLIIATLTRKTRIESKKIPDILVQSSTKQKAIKDIFRFKCYRKDRFYHIIQKLFSESLFYYYWYKKGFGSKSTKACQQLCLKSLPRDTS